MIIQRTKKEVIIRLSTNVDTEDLQKFLNYARYKELTSNFKVSQDQVNCLVDNIKKIGKRILKKQISENYS